MSIIRNGEFGTPDLLGRHVTLLFKVLDIVRIKFAFLLSQIYERADRCSYDARMFCPVVGVCARQPASCRAASPQGAEEMNPVWFIVHTRGVCRTSRSHTRGCVQDQYGVRPRCAAGVARCTCSDFRQGRAQPSAPLFCCRSLAV